MSFFFVTFCCIVPPISVIIDHYCVMENLKKSGKKQEQIKNNIPEKTWKIEERQA